MVASSHPSTSVAHASSVVEVASIFEPWCNIAHLKRDLDPNLDEESHALTSITWDEFCSVLPGKGTDEGIDGSALGAEFAQKFGRDLPALQQDLLSLAELVQDLTGASAIGVRLMRLEKPACPNLHFDRVGLRAVTTYQGPGTEYLPDSWAPGENRSSVNLRERKGLDAAQGPIRTSSAGDVLLLKGTLWLGNEEHGAVHRSPAFCSSAPRIVATFDPL